MSNRPKWLELSGKAKWVNIARPDPTYQNFSLVLYPDEKSLGIIKDLKENPPTILNMLKKDEDGYFMKFSCPSQKIIRGKLRAFSVDLINKDEQFLPVDLSVGNGSDVTIKLEYYTWEKPKPGAAVRLNTVRVDNLVNYSRTFETPKKTEETTPLF